MESLFQTTKARSVFCGVAAHGLLPLERIITASFGIVLIVLAHANGWLVPRGGSVRIALALESEIRSLGGKILTGNAVRSIKDIPEAKAILFDLTPRQILDICGDRLPSGYRKQLQRYRYGPGAFKIDWALSEPIPFKAPVCRLASTVHLCGNYDEISESERSVWRGLPPERPFVLLTQPSIFDPTRAPQGKHTAWAYCHVPANSRVDMTQAIENQVERFAPGFRDIILARHVLSPYDLEKYNENYVGGEINGGVQDLRQLFTRPTLSLTPYRMPVRGLYICSSSTPPGGGVHGMCGYHAAKTALKDLFNLDAEEIKWPD
jgi:phytoene dehydrogenase-like protein